jgi:hypothetical protein
MYRPQTTNLKELQKREEEDEIFQFLASLDLSYEVLRYQILLSEDLPSFDKIANMIQREESRRVVMNTQTPETEEAKAFAAYRSFNANPRPATRGDQGIHYEYYKKEECWCLHPHLRPKGIRRGEFNKGVIGDMGRKAIAKRKKKKGVMR